MRLKFFTLFLVLFVFETKALFAGEVRFVSNKVDVGVFGKEATKTSFEGDVYDLSFVAYDKDFAEEFGLKQELITSMDKGLRFMEVKMITEGKQTNCHYNLVLDKSVEVAFPRGRNYSHTNNPTIYTSSATSFLPSQGDPTYKTRLEEWARFDKLFRNSTIETMHKYTNRLYIGTQDYQKDKPRAKNTSSINYYIQDRLNYQILSITGHCSSDANAFKYPKPSVWVARRNDIEYNILVGVDPDYFNRFLIPEVISKQFAPIILEFQKSVRDTRKEKEKIKEKEQLNKNKKSLFNFFNKQ